MFRNNDDLNRAMMGRFGRLIDDLGLKDLPLHGRKYIRGLICKIDLTLLKLDTQPVRWLVFGLISPTGAGLL